MMENNKGQMMIIGLMFLIMTVLVLTAFLPVLKETLDDTRHQDSLNCKSNINVCSSAPASPCYNSSMETETTGCLLLDLYVPYIVIAVLVGGVSFLLMKGPISPQPQYGGY